MEKNRILRYLNNYEKIQSIDDNLSVINLNFNPNNCDDELFNNSWIIWYHHKKNNWNRGKQ